MTIRFFQEEMSATKGFRGGTHRTCPPTATELRVRAIASQLGVTRLADITGLDDIGVPVFVAVHPNQGHLSTSQGKGPDRTSAATSALMEAIERWHAANRRPADCVASPAELARAGERHLVTDELPRRRPRALGRDERIGWLRGWDFLAGAPVLVPEGSVALDGDPDAPEPPFLVSSSGLGAGNHLLEAAAHGICELIEHDAESLWRASEGLRRIDLEAPRCAWVEDMCERMVAARVAVFAWDMTTDVGVAACGAVVVDDPTAGRWRTTPAAFGFGAHLDPRVALSRAISEAAQTRLTYVSGSRDDLFPDDYAQATDTTLTAEIFEELTAEPVALAVDDLADRSTDTFEGDLDVLLDQLRAVGIEQVACVDLTRPEIGVPVVSVVIPGLEAPSEAAALRGSRLRAAGGVS